MKECNRVFADEVDRVVRSGEYTPSSVSPQDYIFTDPLDLAKKSIVSVHVDDFRTLDNAALVHRFTEITRDPVSTSFTGIEVDQSPTVLVHRIKLLVAPACRTYLRCILLVMLASLLPLAPLPTCPSIGGRIYFVNWLSCTCITNA